MIHVSSACVDITPDRPLELGGSWSRKGPLRSTGVDEAIEANLVLLESAETRVMLLSIDALFAGPDLAADLAARCARQGYPMQVHALATHTHWAPMLDRGKPLLGKFDEAWYREVVRRLAGAARQALQSRRPGLTLSTACRDLRGSVGRRADIRRPVLHGRRIKRSGTLMGPNLAAPRAPACRVSVLRHSDGSIACVLVSCACHPADRPATDRVSPDYVGAVRRAVRSRLGDHPVLFLQGFSGDVRAHIPMRPRLSRSVRRLMRGPVFMVPTLDEWQSWATHVATQVAAVADEAAERPGRPADVLRGGEAHIPLSLILGELGRGTCRARTLAIGDQLELFMMSAEVSAGYAPLVERLGLWPVGCLDDVYGYFPMNAQLSAGGYEVDEFRGPFGIRGRFTGDNDAAFAYLLRAARVDAQRPAEVGSSLRHRIA
jgi:hypothetical protein